MQHPEGLRPQLYLIAAAQKALPAEIKDEGTEFDLLHLRAPTGPISLFQGKFSSFSLLGARPLLFHVRISTRR
jgi:hypothetical protein